MVTQYPTYTGQIPILGKIIAEDIPYEEFLETDYGDIHVEWVHGKVIEMPGVDEKHDDILRYLDRLFSIFFEYYGGGRVLRDPMLMRIKEVGVSRSPDIQILLPENLGLLKGLQVIGASDLVIEVVSKDSERIDRIQKLEEYERAGVKEYWIIDPIHEEALFYQLNSEGLYERQTPNEHERYYCGVVKGLWIAIPTLWQKPIPTASDILEWIKGMKSS